MTRAQLIEKLLRTCHLNVPERRQIVRMQIHFSEIMAVIRKLVERDHRFTSGNLTLEKLDGERYRVHFLKYDPQASDLVNDWGGPSIPATSDVDGVHAAAIAFMARMGITRNIDGIEILACPGAD